MEARLCAASTPEAAGVGDDRLYKALTGLHGKAWKALSTRVLKKLRPEIEVANFAIAEYEYGISKSAPPSGEQAENGRLPDGKNEEETEAKLQVCDKEPLRPHVDQGMCYNRRPVKCGPEPSEVAALGPQERRELDFDMFGDVPFSPNEPAALPDEEEENGKTIE
jgi:hypothetical protein